MYKDFIYQAVNSLESIIGQSVSIRKTIKPYDVELQINKEAFQCITKINAKNANYGILIASLNGIDYSKNNIIIADYLTSNTAEKLKQNGINYLDAVGNTYIKTKDLFIYVEGRKTTINKTNNQTRAFQEAGLKLLLLVISNPETLQFTYRELAEKTGIALGSVSNIFKELEDNHYLFKIKGKRVLKNQNKVIERWVIAYNEILKPRSFRRRMRALKDDFNIDRAVSKNINNIYLGGEPGGKVLTNHLKPKDYIIYTNEALSKIAKDLELVPDESGNIEIYNRFWTDGLNLKNEIVAPPLVVYADLLGTSNNRNIETANLILENGL